jgi:hypothetical protein
VSRVVVHEQELHAESYALAGLCRRVQPGALRFVRLSGALRGELSLRHDIECELSDSDTSSDAARTPELVLTAGDAGAIELRSRTDATDVLP